MENHSFGRIISAIISPTKTFQSIAERPTWLVAVLFLVGVSLITITISAPKLDWEATVRSELEKSGQQFTPDQIETQVGVVEKFGNVMMYVSVTVFPWIIYPLMGAIFLGLFRLLGSEMSFKTSLSVVVHSLLPWGLAALLSIPVLIGLDSIVAEQLEQGVLMSHLGAVVSEDTGPSLTSLAGSIDLFSFWTLALMVIGFSIAAKVSKGRAATVVIVTWLIYVLGKAGFAGLGQMLGG